ncbi:MAG: DUF1992 domain-containing protein [Acidobacteria bacterium]|nr:DUF1992 domain-containing protein [Acidobacteriota bacterium]
MDIFAWIAAERIEEGIREGKFRNLLGEGKPLDLNDDDHIAPEMRLAFRIMKNAGVTPVEVSLRKEIDNLRKEIKNTHSKEQRAKLERELRCMTLRMSLMMERK